MSPPAQLANLQHANCSREPQEDYWREQQQQQQGREEEASASAAAEWKKTGGGHAADLLFPPAFITLAGLACWHAPPSPLFSAPVLLLALVPCYVLGVLLFVVKLGGFAPPQARLPGSRLVASSAASLLSASFLSFVAWQLPLLWSGDEAREARAVLPLPRLRLRVECATLVLCFSLFLALQLSLARSDPGRVAAAAGGKGGASSFSSSSRPPAAAAAAAVPSHHAGSCTTCTSLRPLRSKHCRACDRCTLLFDHHCPVVANCVGARTLPRFFLFLKVTLTGQFLMLRLASVAASIAFSRGAGGGGGEGSSFLSVLAAASTRARGQLLLCLVQAPIFASTAFLVARAAFCAAANLTVNELANRERYAYLRHSSEDGEAFVYCNRFDRGVAVNLAAFFGLEGLLLVSPLESRRGSDHYWSEKLDEALAEHGPAGPQPAPFGTRAVRWLDGVRDGRRRRRNSKKRGGGGGGGGGGGEGEKSSEFGSSSSTGACAAAPSVDVELAPLWGGGGGGGGVGGTTTL